MKGLAHTGAQFQQTNQYHCEADRGYKPARTPCPSTCLTVSGGVSAAAPLPMSATPLHVKEQTAQHHEQPMATQN